MLLSLILKQVWSTKHGYYILKGAVKIVRKIKSRKFEFHSKVFKR